MAPKPCSEGEARPAVGLQRFPPQSHLRGRGEPKDRVAEEGQPTGPKFHAGQGAQVALGEVLKLAGELHKGWISGVDDEAQEHPRMLSGCTSPATSTCGGGR